MVAVEGYDPDFRLIPVPLPTPTQPAEGVRVLPFTHFTVAPAARAYRTYQVPIADLATLTGLDLGPLPAAGRLPAPARTATGESWWRRLRQLSNQAL